LVRALVQAFRAKFFTRNEHLRATGFYLGERIYAIGLAFLTYTIFARSYGPSLIGSYSYALTVMQFAVPFLASGSEVVIIRELVQRNRPIGEIMGSGCAVLSAVGLAVTLVPLIFILLTRGDDTVLLKIAGLTAIGFIPNGLLVAEQALKAELRVVPVVTARMMAATVGAAAKVIVVVHGFRIEFVPAISTIEAFLLSGLLLLAYQRSGYSIRTWKLNPSYALVLLKQSTPLMISSVMVMLFFRANHVLLFLLSGPAIVGQYAVAFSVMQLFLIFPTAFFNATYPRLVAAHARDRDHYKDIINACFLGFSCLGYLIILFNLFFGRAVFQGVFGPKYDVAASLIIILSVANLFDFEGAVRAQLINIERATHYHLWNALVGLLVLLFFDAILIPTHGAAGACWSITLAFFASAILTSFIFPKTRTAGWAQLKALALVPAFAGRLARMRR
jgi:O-antigen/teichoic acid export membrane protein